MQFTLKGRYEHDAILREIRSRAIEEIRSLRRRVRELPEDASYYDRVRLGELIVAKRWRSSARSRPAALRAAGTGRGVDMRRSTSRRTPEDVVNAAFLVERTHVAEVRGRRRGAGSGARRAGSGCGCSGPLAPYDFVPEE